MRPPRNATARRHVRDTTIHHLNQKPNAEKKVRRDLAHRNKNSNRYQSNNLRMGVIKEVAAENSSNCSRRSNERDRAVHARRCLRDVGTNTDEKIKEKVFDMAQSIFNVVAKYMEEEHVGDDMHPAAM